MDREKWKVICRSLGDLREHFSRLSTQLEQGTQQLHQGRLPDETLTTSIATVQQQFTALVVELRSFVQASAVIDDGWQQPDSLEGIQHWLTRVAAEQEHRDAEEQRSRALALIGQILTLTHTTQSAFAPLQLCQQAAQTLHDAILQVEPPALHTAVPQLLTDEHPLSALLRLVDEAELLDDITCDRLTQIVSAQFDPILAISAMRGRLIDRALVKYVPIAEPPPQEAAAAGNAPLEERRQPTAPLNATMPAAPVANVDSIVETATTVAPEPEPSNPLPAAPVLDAWEDWPRDMANAGLPMPDFSAKLAPAEQPAISSDQEAALTPRPLLKSTQPRADIKELAKGFRAFLGDIDVKPNAERPIPTTTAVLEEHDIAPDASAQQIAAQLLNSQRPWRLAILQRLCWQLIAEDQLAHAYHLARGMAELADQPPQVIPPELIRSLLCTGHVRFDIGSLSSQIAEDLGYVEIGELEQSANGWADAIALLVASAALRSSILAPNSQAWVFLKQLLDLGLPRHPILAELRSYCEAIANFGSYRQPLDLNALSRVKSQDVWEKELEAFYTELERWWEQAQARKIAYAPATSVWRYWLRPGQLIHTLLKPVLDRDFSQTEQVRSRAQSLSDPDTITRAIHHTDRVELNRQKSGDIDYGAGGQIRLLAEQAVDFAGRWLALEHSRPNADQSYLHLLLQNLKQVVEQKQPLLEEKLAQLVAGPDPLPRHLQVAIQRFRQAMQAIHELFDPSYVLTDQEPKRKYLFNGILLGDPEVTVDDEWRPVASTEQLLYTILQLVEQRTINWVEVLRRRSNQLDHQTTAYILEYLDYVADPAIDRQGLAALRAEDLRNRREALNRAADNTLHQVEGAVAYGVLREQERNEYVAAIEQVRLEIPKTLLFMTSFRTLYEIGEQVKARQTSQIEAVRQHLQANVDTTSDAYQRISTVLDAGDPLTANEYIGMVRKGDALPEQHGDVDVFANFFPHQLLEIERFLDRGFEPMKEVKAINTYARGQLRTYALGPVDMYDVPGPQARQVAEMVEAWFATKRARQLDQATATTIFDCLGFHTRAIVEKDSRRLEYQVQTDPIGDKTLCPVWQYGSGAQGVYRLFCVWDRPTEEELVNKIGDTVRRAPVIIFYFGRMTQQRRRHLARLCRERRRTCIVLDDTLLIYLCGFRAPRLSVFFRCALPFTFLEPYTTTAGVVPPEMFYGRQSERALIAEQMGSCFIYGGRQLGKTALLRDVERNYHRPEQGQVVVWLDLKASGIGYDRSIDEIWNLLARTLKNHNVIPATTPAHTGADRILEHIEVWLQQDQQRRILLLLDEADHFLESDGRGGDQAVKPAAREAGGAGFRHASRMKYLMDRTDRRFKVVFAGLHNVQRTTRQSNHPLAHYGEPICIGPLLEDNEWRAARDLIEKPLMSIGCRFRSPDLVTRILSQTNYYPSLIQLYCTELLRHLMESRPALLDSAESPPYMITMDDVNEVYLSPELRNSIRQRFNWTLQLDQRYEVLAHAVAHETLHSEGSSLVDGFPDAWLQQQAMTWWPQGFATCSSQGDIRALADEMVGLGILRTTQKHAFTLRSPNVLLLMGTSDDIEGELLRERERPIEYEPSVFRSAYRNNGLEQPGLLLAHRSPLTAAQEAELRQKANGVSLIIGNHAAGLAELAEFLAMTFGSEYTHILDETVLDLPAFAKALTDLGGERERDGTTLFYVPATAPWSTAWLEEAARFTKRLRAHTAFVRVAFVANPRTTWQLLAETDGAFDTLQEQGVTTLSLKPWHDTALRQWLEDSGFGPRDSAGRQRIAKVTGNWPLLLYEFYRFAQPRLRNWEAALDHLATTLEQPETHTKLYAAWGLQQAEHQTILKALCDWRDVHDVLEMLGDYPPALVHKVLQWADLLHLAHAVQRDQWQVDPLVARLLQSHNG